MRVYHAHKTPEMLAEEPQLRPHRALHREGRRPHHLRRPADQPGQDAAAGAARLPRPVHARRHQHGPHPAVLPLLLRPRASRSSTTRRWTRGWGPGRTSSSSSRRFRLMFDGVFNHASAEEPLVPALPERPARLRGLLRRLQHPGRHRSRLPAADPAAAHVRPAHALPDHQRRALRVDHVQPRPGGPQLQERAGPAARARDPARLRAARRRHDPPGRGDLHLARARHALRPPARDARAGQAVPRDPRRGGAAGRARHRDQRAARGQRRLLRRRRGRGADGLQLRAAAAGAAHVPHAATPRRAARWAAPCAHVSSTATYFNFLASHDGVGLSGAAGHPEPRARSTRSWSGRCAHGGLVSLSRQRRRHAQPVRAERHLVQRAEPRGRGRAAVAAGRPLPRQPRAIALALMGVPGIYLPSLFGAKNDTAAVLEGSENRSINRKTIDETALFELLRDRHSWVHEVAVRFRRLRAAAHRDARVPSQRGPARARRRGRGLRGPARRRLGRPRPCWPSPT